MLKGGFLAYKWNSDDRNKQQITQMNVQSTIYILKAGKTECPPNSLFSASVKNNITEVCRQIWEGWALKYKKTSNTERNVTKAVYTCLKTLLSKYMLYNPHFNKQRDFSWNNSFPLHRTGPVIQSFSDPAVINSDVRFQNTNFHGSSQN